MTSPTPEVTALWRPNVDDKGRRYYQRGTITVHMYSQSHEIWRDGRMLACIYTGVDDALAIAGRYYEQHHGPEGKTIWLVRSLDPFGNEHSYHLATLEEAAECMQTQIEKEGNRITRFARLLI